MKKNLLILFLILLSLFFLTLLIRPTLLISSYNEKSNQNTENNKENLVSDEGDTEIKEQDNQIPQTSNVLDLSNQGLEKLPSNVLSQTDLEVLDISENNITGALPAEIRHLQDLRVLDASDNAMTGVPAEVGQLGKLEVLNLSNNQLTGLPYELGNLKNLKILNLSGNNYAQQDLDKIKESLPADAKIIL